MMMIMIIQYDDADDDDDDNGDGDQMYSSGLINEYRTAIIHGNLGQDNVHLNCF